MHNKLAFILLVILAIINTSCTNDPIVPDNPTGKIKFEFLHKIDGKTIVFDSLMYTNEAGNKYLVNEIQYFISDVSIINNEGVALDLNSWENIHYIDTDIIETHSYTFKDDIPIGTYRNIRFTFGIDEEKNQSLMFVNPPESYMFWPENLGGGYHYMKLNGKWVNEAQQLAPFNFHLGIGQLYQCFPDSIIGYVQNYFQVNIPESVIKIGYNETTTLQITMNVDSWFTSPHVYDHNYWGGDIMQKQDALQQVVDNGHDVFTYTVLN